MVVTQEWNQALDSDGEPYVRHGGREGLPAVWCMGRTNGSFRDRTPPVWDGRRDGWWCGMRSCVCVCVCVCGVVFLGKECSLCLFSFKNVGLWSGDDFATVVDGLFVSCLQLWCRSEVRIAILVSMLLWS
jgi:hypothetical protein